MNDFQKEILAGIPEQLPEVKEYDKNINHAPKRKDILTKEQKRLALKNALRYFPERLHAQLAPEFYEELENTAAFTCTVTVLRTRCMPVLSTNIRRNAVRLQPSC